MLDDIEDAITVSIKGILVKTGKYSEGDKNKINKDKTKSWSRFAGAIEEILGKIKDTSGQWNK